MSSTEFAEWKGFLSELCPLPGERADAHTMMISAAMFQAFSAKRDARFRFADFMPWLKAHRPQETPEQIEKRMMAWGASHNAAVGKGTPPSSPP